MAEEKEQKGIKPREISEEMKASYIDYAMSVIVSRALPDVRDGLKPVHRRILYAMHEMGLFHNQRFRKSASVVGECFIKDTLTLTDKGLVPIQNIKINDKVYTQNGLKRVSQLFEMPPKQLLEITLENGVSNTATPSQRFKIIDKDWNLKWKEAKDLTSEDYIVNRAHYPKKRKYFKLKKTVFGEKYLNEDISYLLGLFISDGSISNDYSKKKLPRIAFTLGDEKEMAERIVSILEKEFGYKPNILPDYYKYVNVKGKIHNNKKYNVRINNKNINDFFVLNFNLKGAKAFTKRIPFQIFQSSSSVIFSFISGLIDGDGSVHKNRSNLNYTSISKTLINELQILLQHQNIFSGRYKSISKSSIINKRKIISRHQAYSLEIKGENLNKLAKHLNLASNLKKQRIEKIISNPKRVCGFNCEIIPYAGNILFEELSRKHLGGGWYEGLDGNKFRSGIKYKTGCKIRYSSNLLVKPLRKSQIADWGIEDKLEKIGFSKFDFLKEVIDKKIYFIKVSSVKKTAPQKTFDLQVEDDHEFIANGMISHNCLGKYHPHGDMAVYDSLVRMAQDFSLRYPLIMGQGNFGCFTKDTKVKLTDNRSLSFGELIKEQKRGIKHWGFSFNQKDKKIEIAEIKNPRLTRKKEKIMEVTLDNGEKIECTLDHRFMLRDGSYCQAQELREGESLMPFYEKERINNDVPNIENALNYFSNLSDIVLQAKKRNHKVVRVKFLRKREDVYDLTIDKWHNFLLGAGVFVHNSIDNDPAAAQRYTEAKMSKIGEEMLADIKKETVNFRPNYDGTRKEPVVLPSPLPQLLLNGSLGIAVGMATNIPPHNLSELCDALMYLADNPKTQTEDIAEFVKGPDFPTGGAIYSKKDIIEAYSQGKGPIVTRGKAEIVENKSGKTQIIISEIPYQVSKASLVQQLAKLVQDKKIQRVKDIRDESDKEGMRIVLDLQKDAFGKKILNRLWKFTDLQKTFHLNMIALVGGIHPTVLSLADVLSYFLDHRKEVVTRRTKYDLEKAKERAHILEGLHKCLDKIDAVIKTIKNSKDREDAKKNLMKEFKLTEIQSNAILETKLSALAKLERKKIEDELKYLKEKIKEYAAILESPAKIKAIVKKELKEIKERFGDERKTKVFAQKVGEIAEEDLVPQEETIITLTQGGYIKRINPSTYKIQKRGGKGILGMKTIQEDVVDHFLAANTHDSLLFFTDSGKVFRTVAYEIPEATRVARGRGLSNFIEISSEDRILSLMGLGKEDADAGIENLVMVTKKGIIKKTHLDEFKNVRKSGLIAIGLKKDDLLRKVVKSSDKNDIIVITKKGQSIKFKEKDIRSMGRPAAGIRGIRLKKDDEVIGMDMIKNQKEEKEYLLVLSENGYGKRTDVKEYREQGRGGSGIKTANITSKTGNLVFSSILTGEGEEDLIVISQKGQIIRTKISSIPKLSRATQGVRIMRLGDEDKVASAACI